MNFMTALLSARSHLAFLAGLGLAFTTMWQVQHFLDKAMPGTVCVAGATEAAPGHQQDLAEALHVSPQMLPLRATGQPLTSEEVAWARAAWRYFERNYQPETGLVNSNDNYPSTTLWDLGSYVMGLLSAERLGVVDSKLVSGRLVKLLDTLVKLPLVDGKLPNKAYHTRTLEMVDYNNEPVKGGVGWSAIDVARLGVPLNVILWRHPELTQKVRAVFAAWRLDEVVSGGELQGSRRRADGALQFHQEGRLGYEQYAARSLLLLGLDVSAALDSRRHLGLEKVSGQRIAYDARRPGEYGAHNAILSEPYVLQGLELGFEQDSLTQAQAVLQAQANRAKEVGRPVAVSEDNLDRPPYFVYNSVLNDGKPWAAFAPDGADASEYRTLSTKAALGWAYLFTGPYPEQLRRAAMPAMDPEQGWYSGRYDASGALNKALTANTNGIVLEALAYKVQGPWLHAAHQP